MSTLNKNKIITLLIISIIILLGVGIYKHKKRNNYYKQLISKLESVCNPT